MNNKNKYGQYFTIEPIAEFMTGLITKPAAADVLEPSCGEGVFLEALRRRGYRHVRAYEIDGSLAGGYDFVRHESFVSSPLDEKFDVVIGNPPYIRWKNLERELKEELLRSPLWNAYFNNLCDYLFIFILKSIEQLREGGELIFICTEYWMNTTHSKALRDYMCAHGYIAEIYHFKESPLFQGVTASFVVFRYVKDGGEVKPDIQLYNYIGKGTPSLSELEARTCFDRQEIPQFEEGSRWILASREIQDELTAFETACSSGGDMLLGEPRIRRIGDVCEIGNGMVSGLDAAFNVTHMENLTAREQAALIRVLKAKDLAPFNKVHESRYFYLPEELSAEEFRNDYPNFYAYLQPSVAKLKERYSYNRDIPYWSFVFPRNKKLFDRAEEKIFIPCKERISKKNYFRFCLAPVGYYPLQDVTGIVRKPVCRESIEYLLYFLNSRYVFDWLVYNGIVKGNIVEFSEAPIANIPYRAINWDNREEVEKHRRITEGVRLYLTHGSREQWAEVSSLFNQLFV